jgi:hypothetical protein
MAVRVTRGSSRSPVLGIFLTTLALVPMVTSCTKAVQENVPVQYAAEWEEGGDKIVGATASDGTTWSFQDPGASVVGEQLVARAEPDGATVRIPMEDLSHVVVERRESDGGKTALFVIGVAITGIALIALIAAASAEPDPQPSTESCPFIYSWDGNTYVLDAEPYGGATTRGLERDDFTELEHLVASDGVYRLRVANELEETQHTNQFELWAIDHAPGVRVVPDVDGNLYALEQLVAPVAATDGAGRDLLPWLASTDFAIWEPLPETGEEVSSRRRVVLEFDRPDGADRARLVARVATGLWGSHMIREMLAIRGERLDDWYRWVDEDPAAREMIRAWSLREELFELKVWVEEPTGWELRGLLPGGGPYVSDDRVVELDVSRVKGDRLRIRLDPPAGFWALNSFAVNWGGDEPFELTRLAPVEARDAANVDLVGLLSGADDRYHVMEETGQEISVVFEAPPPVPDLDRTLILHSRGYYRLRGVGTGSGDPGLVTQIEWIPGAVHRFSAEAFAEWQRRLAASETGMARAGGY